MKKIPALEPITIHFYYLRDGNFEQLVEDQIGDADQRDRAFLESIAFLTEKLWGLCIGVGSTEYHSDPADHAIRQVRDGLLELSYKIAHTAKSFGADGRKIRFILDGGLARDGEELTQSK